MSGAHFARPAGATARKLLLGDRLEVGERFGFYYDFGDSWRHEVLVERRVFPVPERPVVVAGERACPPEDCGGVSGYERVLAMLAKPGRRSLEQPRYNGGEVR